MDFKITELIPHPRERVYLTYRDRLADLVPFLPNVDSIEVLERKETASGIFLLNRWKVSGAIPRPVRPFFSDRAMTYLDHAIWDDGKSQVAWRLEIGLFPEAVQCQGVNHFTDGPGPGTTEVVLTGSLQVDLARVRGVPRLLYGLARTVEGFVLERIKPNLVSVARAVARSLDEKGQGPS